MQPDQNAWQTLSSAGLVKPDSTPSETVASPWYVKVLLAFSGWLAALFGLAFLGLSASIFFQSPTAAFVGGLVLIIAGLAISRLKGNEFVDNLGLIVSLVGQGLLLFGFADFFSQSEHWIPGIFGGLNLLLVILSSSYLHRVVFSILIVCGFTGWMLTKGWPVASIYMFLVPVAILWLNEFRWPRAMSALRPIAYGLTIGLIAMNLMAMYLGGNQGIGNWLNEIGSTGANSLANPISVLTFQLIAVATVIYTVWQCLDHNDRFGVNLTTALSLIGVIVLAVVALPAQGVIIGIVILLCGFSASNRVLTGLGIITLLTFMSAHYYQMDTTLLAKSINLAILGAGLLISRLILARISR